LATDWRIERLTRQHDRTNFDCGVATLTDWLKLRSSQYARKNLAQTYVAVEGGTAAVMGYYAISTHHVQFDTFPEEGVRGLPKIDLPVVLLGRLAVDRRCQGQGLGVLLLVDALRRAVAVARHVGVRAVEVDAIDDSARDFYRRFGFVSLLDDDRHMYVSIDAVQKLDLPPMVLGE
jgi:GNAT superfamily N-acetyltransferase